MAVIIVIVERITRSVILMLLFFNFFFFLLLSLLIVLMIWIWIVIVLVSIIDIFADTSCTAFISITITSVVVITLVIYTWTCIWRAILLMTDAPWPCVIDADVGCHVRWLTRCIKLIVIAALAFTSHLTAITCVIYCAVIVSLDIVVSVIPWPVHCCICQRYIYRS